ncbi:hypothetical protein GOP47_0014382 [Adiantum capillus-veneris]|uniref:Uncharacterized protein n=1 Tax=Adiantum capillus-veneris TaxID=13818 RepID=A0A9D4ULE0_ADICA|nr:hypothetical protein GOP47_0014382 [Adiantum capillus-veneris]
MKLYGGFGRSGFYSGAETASAPPYRSSLTLDDDHGGSTSFYDAIPDLYPGGGAGAYSAAACSWITTSSTWSPVSLYSANCNLAYSTNTLASERIRSERRALREMEINEDSKLTDHKSMQQKNIEKPKARLMDEVEARVNAMDHIAKRSSMQLAAASMEEESCSTFPEAGALARNNNRSSTALINAHANENAGQAVHEEDRRTAGESEHGPLVGCQLAPNKSKKRATRHAPAVIAHLEDLFQECPNPNEAQRLQLSGRLGLTVEQVRYWFQNRRTQLKSENSRRENTLMKDENDRLRAENLMLRHAMENAMCPCCGGPVSMQKSFELQQIKLNNASMKDQLERYYGLGSTLLSDKRAATGGISSLNRHASTSVGGDYEIQIGGNLGVFQKSRRHNAQKHLLPVTSDELMVIEKDMIAELALVALEELITMTCSNEPLWAISPSTHKEVLNFDEYLRQFPRGIGPLRDGYQSEASRETSMVTADAHFVVESFLNAKRWMELFPCIVTKADMGEIISSGSPITRDGALQLMFAEIQVPSPVVPTCQVYFLRFCKMVSGGTWAVVDVSVDNLRGDSPSTAHKCRKRPSGCLIQQLPDGLSKITWMEHFEFDNSIHQHPFRPLVISGIAFSAQRWLATLKRQCAWHAILIANSLSSRGLGSEEAGKVALLKLGQSMTKQLCCNVSSSLGWVTLTGNFKGKTEERVMTRESAPLMSPYNTFSMILSAASSFWLPVLPHVVFEFLSNPDRRKEWDILSLNGSVEELVSVSKGQDCGNYVSLLRPKLGDSKMLILQDCCTDALSSTFVYAPVDMIAMNELMRAENSFYQGKPIIPSGFVIMPDGRTDEEITSKDEARNMSNTGGSLVTVVFQLLVSRREQSKMDLEPIKMMNTLVCNTAQSIKDGMKLNELSNQEEAQSSKTPSLNKL